MEQNNVRNSCHIIKILQNSDAIHNALDVEFPLVKPNARMFFSDPRKSKEYT